MILMTEAEAKAWRPDIIGWSEDILPFYQMIASWLEPTASIVEVGVAHGRSALFMHEELKKLGKNQVTFYAVDTSPQPPAIDGTDIIYIQSQSSIVADNFEDKVLDFVFIDATHEYEGISEDIKCWLPKVRSGGILAGHDYHATDWPGVVRAVDEAFGVKIFRPTRTVWEYRCP